MPCRLLFHQYISVFRRYRKKISRSFPVVEIGVAAGLRVRCYKRQFTPVYIKGQMHIQYSRCDEYLLLIPLYRHFVCVGLTRNMVNHCGVLKWIALSNQPSLQIPQHCLTNCLEYWLSIKIVHHFTYCPFKSWQYKVGDFGVLASLGCAETVVQLLNREKHFFGPNKRFTCMWSWHRERKPGRFHTHTTF